LPLKFLTSIILRTGIIIVQQQTVDIVTKKTNKGEHMNRRDTIKYIALLIALVGARSLFSETPNNVTVRTWTDRSGQTINAAFVSMQYDMVNLKKEDGKIIKISRAKLSVEDQKEADKLASSTAPSLKKAKPTEANSVTVRTWTDRSGQNINAAFVKMQYGMVYLKKEDGKIIKISRAQLSVEDQKEADTLAYSTAPSSKKTKVAEAPKAPDAIYDLFGSKLKNAKKRSVSVDELSNKIIGVYFSAHWCPPCRAFTPKLVEFHDSLQKSGKPFEVVFVSSDRDKKAMYKYMKEMKMPWLALPHGDKHKESLSTKYSVRGIPKLVILNSSGEVITENGRGEVMSGGTSAFDKWQSAK
jgi:nucleoredoxin